MSGPDTVSAARATCEAVLARHGAELVELVLGREGKGRVLRVTLERPDGAMTLDEIAGISEEISRALDAEDPIEGRYTLEVASPGIERPLLRPDDYRRFAEREVKVRCVEPIEGSRNFRGRIASAGDESFVLHVEGEVEGTERVEIPYVAVARAKLVVDWDTELGRTSQGSIQRLKGQRSGGNR